MIQILLLILKIIGITLLAVLGTVLLVLAAVLFVPIFYRVKIIRSPEKTQVKARISFLFPLFLVTAEYLQKLSYKVRIFGRTLLDSEKPKADKPEKKRKPKKKNTKQKKQRKKENPPETLCQEKQNREAPVTSETRETNGNLPHEKIAEAEKKGFFEKIRSKIAELRETISNIVTKIMRLFRQKEEAQRIFAKKETKTALKFAWDKLKHLLKHILPRKVKGYVAYGAGDPATTGQVLGILSIIYARTGEMLTIRPNFVEKQLECDVELKGRIQVFTLLVIAVKVILNQELKQLLEEVKGIKEI